MALDRAHDRLFIPAYGNGGYRAFQLDEQGLPEDRSAMYVIGRESLYGRRSNPVPDERELNFPGAISLFDTSTQRLFGLDRFNNRILVFDAHPDRVRSYPAAHVVIGQKDFTSTERGVSARRTGMMASGALDEEGQRLFVADPPNHRVLVFDVHPERLDSDPAGIAVIGQSDFESRERGVGPDKLSGPSSVAYDPVFQRLFVSDTGNHRVLVFDVDPERLTNAPEAIAVMGQPDFYSRAPRKSLAQLKPESLAYDWAHHRLFIAEDLEHRVMVYDAHPDRIRGPAKAMAVIGQPDAFSVHPAVARNRVAMPRLNVNPETQKLYISEGFPAGNRIAIFDISPENLKTGMDASDVVGHENPFGGPDFDNRMAQDHLDGRTLAAARAVALDPVDHRLFVADEYNHRVVVWGLDALNRVADRQARWVLGQPDLRTSHMREPDATNMAVPLAVAYDTSSRRVFVGDGYRNRVLVYEAAPGRLASGMAASVVLGQRDFRTVEYGSGPSGINFGVRMRRGIASNFIPMGLAVDERRQRLFVSDGENNRVVVFDVAREKLESGDEAIMVLGQPDFDATGPGKGARGLHDPGHLAYDPVNDRLFVVDSKNRRVVVFDVAPGSLRPGPAATAVLGQPDLETIREGPFDDASFLAPNGIALDPESQSIYVSDSVVPADRVLVFDVSPSTLESGASAVAVLGASTADPASRRFFGGRTSYPGQFTVRDARGLAVDPENGRLFVTGSFASRVVVFHFPRAQWKFGVPPEGVQYFHTPDAVDLGALQQEGTVRSAIVRPEDVPTGAQAIVSVTEMFVDERTQRHSRMLVSEAAYGARAPSTEATVFVAGADDGRRHQIVLFHLGEGEAAIELVLRDGEGEIQESWRRRLGPGAQEVLELESLAAVVPETGSLVVRSDVPVASTALRLGRNPRGQLLVAPMPPASDGGGSAEIVVPLVENGAGRRTELVLVNATDDELRGTVAFYDRFGERAPLGMDTELVPYTLAPRGSWSFASDGMGPRRRRGYAVVTSEGDRAPWAVAFVGDGAGTGESLVSAGSSRNARFAVVTEPTLIRHGAIETELILTNPGAVAASVRVELAGGASVKRIVPAREQIALAVKEAFGDELVDLLSVESDVPLAVTARQTTVNLKGETIEVELPPLGVGESFPYVPNGDGLATELRLANPTGARAEGHLELRLPSGELARGAILR